MRADARHDISAVSGGYDGHVELAGPSRGTFCCRHWCNSHLSQAGIPIILFLQHFHKQCKNTADTSGYNVRVDFYI